MYIMCNRVQLIINKHCEILVSCSDRERNCMQAHETACKLMKLRASLWYCMQAYVTACKLMELHVNFSVTACKLM